MSFTVNRSRQLHGWAVQAVLMQRGVNATQDSCAPRNALRVADEQSYGLRIGFLLRRRRLAARVAAVMTGHSETWLRIRPVKGGFHPSCTSVGALYVQGNCQS